MDEASYDDSFDQLLVDMVTSLYQGSLEIALGPHRVTRIVRQLSDRDVIMEINKSKQKVSLREAWKRQIQDQIREHDEMELKLSFCDYETTIQTEVSALFLKELPGARTEHRHGVGQRSITTWASRKLQVS
eukprot:TRINITY_DN1452_c0_g1_i1.p1 TRINITY_DN1452_c0_g1~~TRINITY_DN1452_c0_g1_i1.p1  ORF type:complete len:140 (+),score=9.63 TRINITY_DN1452_c0_g1_i1:28-420(+)